MTRSLCPYLQIAKYKGAGDTNDAVNFVCEPRLPPAITTLLACNSFHSKNGVLLDALKGVFVTRFTLSPGALLHRMSEGEDILIVGMCDGELVNEAKGAKAHVNITNGFVMLMPKHEPYLLRNIGEKDVDLVVIDVKK